MGASELKWLLRMNRVVPVIEDRDLMNRMWESGEMSGGSTPAKSASPIVALQRDMFSPVKRGAARS